MVFLRDPDGEIVLPVPTTVGSSELGVLVTSAAGTPPPESFPLNRKLWMIPDCCGLLTSVNYLAKKGFTTLAEG